MKKLITTCVLVAAASMVSFAQSKQAATQPVAPKSAHAAATPTPEQIADKHAKMYQQQYGLTPEQYKGVYQAELDYARQDQQVRQNGNQPGEGQVAQMGMARDQRFKAVMSADQYSKYEAAKKTSK